MMKGVKFWAVSCLYALGLIGGFGVAMYSKEYLFAVCIIALGAMAFPYVRKCYFDVFPKK